MKNLILAAFAALSVMPPVDWTRQALRSRSGYASPRSDGYCQRAQVGQAQAAGAEAFGLA
jgi:hypothetical protein